MSHLSDDELVLHYYGEGGPRVVAVERHLQSCAHCAGAYDALARTLNAVVPPEFVEPADDTRAIRHLIRDRVSERSVHAERRMRNQAESGVIALVWLVPLVYPLSLQVLFGSARWAETDLIFIPIVALTLMWACAGPFLAVLALNRAGSTEQDPDYDIVTQHSWRASARLLVAGAVMAAISPALFLLVSRVNVSLSMNPGLWSWYGAVALGSLVACVRWPSTFRSTSRFLSVHRLSALVLSVFVLGHIVNQALAFVSLPAYSTMRSVMRVASQQPASYTLIVVSVAIQMVTGAAMGMKNVRAGAVARNLQAVSGWYLAAFLLMHVFSGLLVSQPQAATAVSQSINQMNLLATPRAAAQLPFLILGVAAFLFHVGVYARLAALAYFAESSVRRLSYAGVFMGTAVIVTVALALCGIHLAR